MATYIKLQFNDNVTINVSTSSFLYKQSTFLQAFDIDEDTTLISGASFAGSVIPILCPSTYVTNKYKKFYFNDKSDLSFMFALLLDKFINVCKFLDIIHYENKDTLFSKQFIKYVMKNYDTFVHNITSINKIQYFMRSEIISILNYINNSSNNTSHENEIMCCTPIFYFLYLTEYKEEVIKYNRQDIFNISHNKKQYYIYIHKYNNNLTYIVKQTQEYNDYVTKLNKQLLKEFNKENNLSKIKNLIERGADINTQIDDINTIYDGNTILHCASHQNNNLEIIKYLVEHGADINCQNKINETPLNTACFLSNNLEVIQYLIKQGADIHLKYYGGNTLLHIAAYINDNLETIKYLVECGINLNLQNERGYTALHIACCIENNLEVIQYLVEQGADIKLKNDDDENALYIANNRQNNINVVRFLIKYVVNFNDTPDKILLSINATNSNGNTMLHYASNAPNNYTEIVQYFIDIGADINAKNKQGNTPLHVAAYLFNNIDIIKCLVNNGADIYMRNDEGKTSLDRAIPIERYDVIEYLRNRMIQ